jgi:hypothetical protein
MSNIYVKYFIVVAFCSVCLLLPSGMLAAEIKLAWDAPTNEDGSPVSNLAGYKVYYGTSARTGADPKNCGLCGYTTNVSVGNVTTCFINNLTLGQNYSFSVVALDFSNNESAFSNEVSGIATELTDQMSNIRVVRHADNTLWSMVCEGISTCSSWTQIPGGFSVQPTLIWDPSIEKYLLMGIGGNGTSIWRSTFDVDGTWNNNWTKITGESPSPVAVAGGGFNSLAPQSITNLTVVRHADNTLWSMVCEGISACSSWTQIPGAFSVQPTLTWDSSIQKYLLMGIGNNGTSIWRSTFDAGGTWNNNWTKITGASPSPVAVAGGGF